MLYPHNIFIHRNLTKIYGGLIFFTIAFLFPVFTYAESGCSVNPFTVTLLQGDRSQLSVLLHLDNQSDSFEVKLGSLPKAVESGFLQNDRMQTVGTFKIIPLIIKTKPDAQVGSFMISVLYSTPQGGQQVCQFNLEIKKGISDSTGKSVDTEEQVTNLIFSNMSTAGGSSTTTTTIKYLFTKNLSFGFRGEDVKLLQLVLKSLNIFPGSELASGYFGSITKKAVMEFQKKNNIEQVGVVGPKTRRALNEASQ